jgi:putative aldouronate transport system permease protein
MQQIVKESFRWRVVVMDRIRKGKAQGAFAVLNYIILTGFGLLMLVPMISVASTSLSSSFAVETRKIFLWPVGFTFATWKYVFTLHTIWRSLALTVFVTIIATFFSIILNFLFDYPLTKRKFALNKIILMCIVISMIFKAPVIPYFLTLRSIGLFDNFLVLILPHLFVSYNIIILVTFLRQIPAELEESAMIEGCGYTRILFNIILPSSKAVCATIGLFYAVMVWNQFYHPLLFIENQNLYPLQLMIRSYISQSELVTTTVLQKVPYNNTTVKAAVVMFSILPIVMVYPFAQKYFVKGAMIGSIKG